MVVWWYRPDRLVSTRLDSIDSTEIDSTRLGPTRPELPLLLLLLLVMG